MTAQNLDESPELTKEMALAQESAAGEGMQEIAESALPGGQTVGEPGEYHLHEVPAASYFLYVKLLDEQGNKTTASEFVKGFELFTYSFLMVLIVLLVLKKGLSKCQLIPGRFQNAVEFIIEAFDNLICGILGRKQGRRFLPFLGTLFIFIILNNYMGMIPGFKAPTASPITTFALAIIVFLYVQYVGITMNGPVGYIYHLMGSPNSFVEWAMVPLMMPLHIVGEIIKPISLALRLMGNIMGEDILIFVCAILGSLLAAAIGLSAYISLPLQLPVFFLSLLLGGIQALVFTLLSTIYFMMMMPHDDHEGEEQH